MLDAEKRMHITGLDPGQYFSRLFHGPCVIREELPSAWILDEADALRLSGGCS